MYLYDLPTTGAVSFADILIDGDRQFTTNIADATQTRATLRAVLKQSKRADDHQRDYTSVIKALDDYLPYLYAIAASVHHHHLDLRIQPVFSWRTTLSSSPLLSPQNPRLSFASLQADILFCHLTHAFATSNAAHSIVSSLGPYEHDKHLSEADRRLKDEKLNSAVLLLCRAAGIFAHLANLDPIKGAVRPPDLSIEVLNALSKLALADAQSLAIRKLLSKAVADAALTPGPPLPKSHPAPVLIAKLYLEISSLLLSAQSLAKTPSATPTPAGTSKFKFKKDKAEDMNIHGEVSAELRRYLSDESTFSSAMSHKWLGVDAGEQGKSGEAIGFLRWAKEELDSISSAKLIGKEKERDKGKKERIIQEIQSVDIFLKGYIKQNNTIHFQPVPKLAQLQTIIPSGRSAVVIKKFEAPIPAFGSDPIDGLQQQTDKLEINESRSPGGERYF